MVGYLAAIKEDNMGKETRRTSGKIIGGSTLVVPDQPVYSVKVFPPTFKYKQRRADVYVPIIPTTTTTTTVPVDTCYMVTQDNDALITQSDDNLIWC